jgi:hypothetical protein
VCPGTSPPLLGTFQERAFLWWRLAAHHPLKPRHEAILATVEPRHERDERLPLWFEPSSFVTLFGLGKMGEGSRIVFALLGRENPRPEGTVELGGHVGMGRRQAGGGRFRDDVTQRFKFFFCHVTPRHQAVDLLGL